MSKRSKRKSKRTAKRYTTFVSSRLEPWAQTDCRRWPVVKAFVPMSDCWRATGCGTAGIVRQRPDGQLITAFFNIVMNHGGLENAFGKDETDLAEIDQHLAELRFAMPPCEEGPAELASRYIWGAYAFGLDDYDWPEEMKARYLRMIPLLPGTRNWWRQQFIGPEGLVPAGLLPVIERNAAPDDLREGMEVAIFTTATFDLTDVDGALRCLRQQEPEFVDVSDDDQETYFDWTREYPPNHWSPLRLLGGRQSLGSVHITPGTLVAECKTLTMAATLVDKLKHLLGDSICLRDAVWKGSSDLLREANRNTDERP